MKMNVDALKALELKLAEYNNSSVAEHESANVNGSTACGGCSGDCMHGCLGSCARTCSGSCSIAVFKNSVSIFAVPNFL